MPTTSRGRLLPFLLVTGILTVAIPQPAASNPISNWGGPAIGNWSDPNSWFFCPTKPGCAPPNSAGIDVWLGTASTINFDLPSATVGTLQPNNANVNILPYNTLNVVNGINGPGGSLTVADHGTLSIQYFLGDSVFLHSAGGITQVQFGAGGVVLPGGNIYLDAISPNSLDRISGATGTEQITNLGTIAGAGQIVGLSKLTNAGLINGGGISRPILYIQSDTFTNDPAGTVASTAGGAVRIESPYFTNLSGGVLTGGTYDSSGKIMMNGTISTIGPNTTVTLRGGGFISTLGGTTNALYNLGDNQGSLNVLGAGNQQFGAPTLVNAQGGAITVAGNSTMSAAGIDNHGLISLGDDVSYGYLNVTGDYMQTGMGELSEFLGSGSLLSVGGDADLSGLFTGRASPGTSFKLGDSFEIASFGGMLRGDFGQLALPTLGAGLAWNEVIGNHEISVDVVGAGGSNAPEPGTLTLFAGAALVGLGMARRKGRA